MSKLPQHIVYQGPQIHGLQPERPWCRKVHDILEQPVESLDFTFDDGKVLAEDAGRLDFLADVGLGYLALDRAAPTLSGGEAQRIRLAAQLGSNLQGVCYVLDEPTIGVDIGAKSDIVKLVRQLASQGTAILVVSSEFEELLAMSDRLVVFSSSSDTGSAVMCGPEMALKLLPMRSCLAPFIWEMKSR